MKKTLSLDLGSASLGWAITTFQSQQESQPEAHGIITFESGMLKGTGGYFSPTKDRREARTARTRLQHRRRRKQTLLKLLLEHQMVPLEKVELAQWSSYRKGKARVFPESENFKKWLACDFTYAGGAVYQNPYELRVKGLETVLTPHEFGRALYHLGQRRGYKDIGEKDKETDKQKKKRDEASDNLLSFQAALDKHKVVSKALKYERLNKNEAFKSVRTRNQLIYRHEYEDELKALCAKQNINIQKEAQDKYKDAFMRAVHKAIIWQRPLKSQKAAVGKCTLEPKRRRCPASHPVYEIFRTWQTINNLKLNREVLKLDLKKWLLREVFLKQSNNFKFEVIRKKFAQKFKCDPQDLELNFKDNQTLAGMPFCKGILDCFGKNKALKEKIYANIDQIYRWQPNEEPKIIYQYSLSDLWHKLYFVTKKAPDNPDYLKAFAESKLQLETKVDKKGKKTNPFVSIKSKLNSGYAALSIQAMRGILYFLQNGYRYDDAVLLACLLKLPNWATSEATILEIMQESRQRYDRAKAINRAVNNLIDLHNRSGVHAADEEFENACQRAFPKLAINYADFKQAVLDRYQKYLHDPQAKGDSPPQLRAIFLDNLAEKGFDLKYKKNKKLKLYHHSNLDNIYGTYINKEDEHGRKKKYLPKAQTPSVKNPMFNKALAILRQLVNYLIEEDHIDSETQIILEIPRGQLNDDNERKAIEKYQKERETNRLKYRQFLEEFFGPKRKVKAEHIKKLELWGEQLEATKDCEVTKTVKKEKVTEIKPVGVRELFLKKEKDALKRYQLWREQRCRCLYTGKMIGLADLFSNLVDVEHTIPRSLLPDNTLANQTVADAHYNRHIKRNDLPTKCPNYAEIKPRLALWEKRRDHYKVLWKSNQKPKGREDEKTKNSRIQRKHYNKMHYEYWCDKVDRFTCEDIEASWVRRQLTDTQMISKYARQFLKTVFEKVYVRKGAVTALFRRIYGFETQDQEKDRDNHIHHVIDAIVLALMPPADQTRKRMIRAYYKHFEKQRNQETELPYPAQKPKQAPHFDPEACKQFLRQNTLAYYSHSDKILKQTKKKILENGVQSYKRGITLRGNLFDKTFLAKNRLDKSHKWKAKKIDDDHFFAKRVPIEKITLEKAEDIVDAKLRCRIKKQLKAKAKVLTDMSDRPIRHLRIWTKSGRKIKTRPNHHSKYDYKNYYYAEAGEIPYALLLQKADAKGRVKRKLIPVAMHEIAQTYRAKECFDPLYFMANFGYKAEIEAYSAPQLLKIGQKVIVLKDESEQNRRDLKFITKRLYKFKQFVNGGILLQHHLAAISHKQAKSQVKELKSACLAQLEEKYELTPLTKTAGEREDAFQKRRIERIPNFNVRTRIEAHFKKNMPQYSDIEVGAGKPYLKLSQENWHFLYEGIDFKMNIDGTITWLRAPKKKTHVKKNRLP